MDEITPIISLVLYKDLSTPEGVAQALILASSVSIKCSLTLELSPSLLIYYKVFSKP